jgi:hypothetical protein
MLKLIIYGDTERYWSASLPFEVILEKRNKQNSGLLIFFFKTNERQQSTLPGI